MRNVGIQHQTIRIVMRTIGSVSAALLLLCAVSPMATPALAQDDVRELMFRGFRFDPLDANLQVDDAWSEMGIKRDYALTSDDEQKRHWRILQFERPLDTESRQALLEDDDLGLRLDTAFSGGYIEFVTLQTVDKLTRRKILRSSIAYHPAFRLSQSISFGREDFVRVEPDFVTKERQAITGLYLLVTLFADADLAATADAIEGAEGVRSVVVMDDRNLGGFARISVVLESEGPLAKIARLDAVKSIEEIGEIIDDNVNAAAVEQSGTVAAGTTVWNRGLTGLGQNIGIIDSGIPDIDHCFFRDFPANSPNVAGAGHRKVLQIRNLTTNTTASSHPTMVGGLAAGDDVNSIGTHPYRSGAFAAKLVFGNRYNFYLCKKNCSTFFAELEAAGNWAHVINNSWHSYTPGEDPYNSIALDVDLFSARYEDHLVIGSAGPGAHFKWAPPALAKNALGVSAGHHTNPMQFGAGFPGPAPGGLIKPDVIAVGCDLYLAVAGTSCGTSNPTSDPSDCDTTSGAAARAAALATLVRQYYVDGWYPSGSAISSDSLVPSGSLLKATLINSAQDLKLHPATPAYPSDGEGWGIAMLDETLYFSGDPKSLYVEDIRHADNDALTTGASPYVYKVDIGDEQPLKVTLVWADAAGESGEFCIENGLPVYCLVNNLDLEVVSPGNIKYKGNVFDYSAGESATGGTADAVNTVEQVIILKPDPGPWTIRVSGTAVNEPGTEAGLQGQGFALVVTMHKPPKTIIGKVLVAVAVLFLFVIPIAYVIAKTLGLGRPPKLPESETPDGPPG